MSQYILNIDVPQFKKALDTLKSVVNTRMALPILADVHLSYDRTEELFRLMASDSESWLTLDMAEMVEEGGEQVARKFVRLLKDDSKDHFSAVCIRYSDLREAIASLPSQYVLEVTIDMDALTMTVNYQIGHFVLPVERADEFPQPINVIMPTTDAYAQWRNRMNQAASDEERSKIEAEWLSPKPVVRFTLGGDKLLRPMAQARCCCANDELRPVMNAELLHITQEGITVVASDGHTLFKEYLQLGIGFVSYAEFPADSSARLLVPKTVLQALIAAFPSDKPLTITADTQRIEFLTQGARLVCRQIDGNYPNYDSVIPQNSPYKMVVSVAALRGALRRIGLFADTASNMAIIRCEEQSFVVSSSDLDFSKEGSERVPVQETDAFLPEGFQLGAKISALMQLLDLVPTENVLMFFSTPATAFLLKPEDVASSRVLMQMPMLIGDSLPEEQE